MEESSQLWYEEPFTEGLRFLYRVKSIIYRGRSKFQNIDILDLEAFGKTLFLDGKIQSAEIDEYIYHEALVHPAMLLHPEPKKVLILGGGEGATLREILKHPVEEVYMVDIDGELVEACRKYMPEWPNGAFEDKRTRLIIDDARNFVFETDKKFDVVISDLTEPLEEGPSKLLFTEEFYRKVKEILSHQGIIAVQSGSADPLYGFFFNSVYKTLKQIFPEVKQYLTFVFSFQMLWGFTLASKDLEINFENKETFYNRIKSRKIQLEYIDPEILPSLFVLPKYLDKLRDKGVIIKDEKPFIWEA
ncbi:MAG TPA: polyamine aminopropyltransferase [candidate division WOR-3 bacterium]|uniref:Polyamine aminopropyltransferase n=1 Tax=candidate division WOR-3 bacterium TaxID=2052148 RepID=A0A7V5HMU5_UNCW3|nr:polyamine aminopropyltransferase [candidate division WOR-3 bacterium]